MSDILFGFRYDIWLFIIRVIHDLFLRFPLRYGIAIRSLVWHSEVMFPKKICYLCIFCMVYVCYLCIMSDYVVFPSGNILFVCVILNMFLHSDFDIIVAQFLWIPYTYMLCDNFVLWICNLYIFFCMAFELFQTLCEAFEVP